MNIQVYLITQNQSQKRPEKIVDVNVQMSNQTSNQNKDFSNTET